MRITGIAIAAFFLLAGCGGGAGGGYDSAQAVAHAAGCSAFKTESPEVFAADAGSCKHDGHYTSIQWFKSADNMTSWLKIASAFGGSDVRGSSWVIECDTRPDCQVIQEKIGGTLD